MLRVQSSYGSFTILVKLQILIEFGAKIETPIFHKGRFLFFFNETLHSAKSLAERV